MRYTLTAYIYTMKTTSNQIKEQSEKFSNDLNALLLAIRDRALAQFQYNIERNIPAGILKVEEVAENAINHGIVSAVSKMNDFSIEPQIKLCAELLEDVNAHSEAAELYAKIS